MKTRRTGSLELPVRLLHVGVEREKKECLNIVKRKKLGYNVYTEIVC